MSKSKSKLFYKVVKEDSKGYTSAVQPYVETLYSRSTIPAPRHLYNKDWNTAPDNTRFFLFETQQEAINFIDDLAITEAERNCLHIKQVAVKGGIAYGCKGVHGSLMQRRIFWDTLNQLLTKSKKRVSCLCEEAAEKTCMRLTSYSSVFARHIKFIN